MTEHKSASQLANETKSYFDEKFAPVTARLDDIEQNLARPSGGGSFETKSIGQQLAESDRWSGYRDNGFRGSLRFETKAITTAGGSAGGLITSGRDTDIVSMVRRTFRVRDLLTVIPTTSGTVDYARQTKRDNKAVPVAEGTSKPYSDYGWSNETCRMVTIAHLAKLTRQAMDDSAQLAAEVDSEMRYGLQLAEDAQLLFGDGTGQNLDGIMPHSTAYAPPAGIVVEGMHQVDKLGLAIVQLAMKDLAPDGIVLSPVDWWQIKLLKDADGRYLFPEPDRLHSLPVAVTNAMPAGKFMLGALKQQKLYDRMAPEVLISSENVDDWERNLATMRCEERLGLAIRRADALIRGDF